MTIPFNANQGLIIVSAELEGPLKSVVLDLVLDSGTTQTIIEQGWLTAVGYDPSQMTSRVRVATASGFTTAGSISVKRLKAPGIERFQLPILGQHFPPKLQIDGLLGLDFFRGHILNINFQQGQIDLT